MAVLYSQNGVIVKPTGFNVIGGKKYKTVQMPDGKIWLAENLDFKFCNIGGSGTPTTANAWYYNNDESTYGWNGYKCGLLYNWYAVKLLNDNKSELIPGWHVATNDEWTALANKVGGSSVAGTKLKAIDGAADGSWPTGWNGTNDYGFGVLPAGYYTNNFYDAGSYVDFWTITESGSSAFYQYFSTSAEMIAYSGVKTNAYTLRLVRDT